MNKKEVLFFLFAMINDNLDINIQEILNFAKNYYITTTIPNHAYASRRKIIKNIVHKCKCFCEQFNIVVNDSLETFVKQAFEEDYEKCTLQNFLQFCSDFLEEE